jgi:cobalamin biosynthesis Mg chelatase CobN
MALTATSGSGTQSTTQSPQSAGTSNISAGQTASGVQPGTASNLLSESSGGVSLHPTALPSVNLSTVKASQVQAVSAPAPHHFNPVLGVLAVLFFAVAIAMFWFTSRSEKITT